MDIFCVTLYVQRKPYVLGFYTTHEKAEAATQNEIAKETGWQKIGINRWDNGDMELEIRRHELQ